MATSGSITLQYDPSTDQMTSTSDVVTIDPNTSSAPILINLQLAEGQPGDIQFSSPAITWIGGVTPTQSGSTSIVGNPVQQPNGSWTLTITENNNNASTTVYSFFVNATYTRSLTIDPSIVNTGTN